MIELIELAAKVVEQLKEKGLTLVTVESCTGGGLANAITNIPGASEVFADGFVVYSNEAKIQLGVSRVVLDRCSVYSLETAKAMAHAGLRKSIKAELGIGITGSLTRTDPANPSSSKVGEVYIAIVKLKENWQASLGVYPANVAAQAVFQIEETDRVKAKERIVLVALAMLAAALQTDLLKCSEEVLRAKS